jgi:hypothetical protein
MINREYHKPRPPVDRGEVVCYIIAATCAIITLCYVIVGIATGSLIP